MNDPGQIVLMKSKEWRNYGQIRLRTLYTKYRKIIKKPNIPKEFGL